MALLAITAPEITEPERWDYSCQHPCIYRHSVGNDFSLLSDSTSILWLGDVDICITLAIESNFFLQNCHSPACGRTPMTWGWLVRDWNVLEDVWKIIRLNWAYHAYSIGPNRLDGHAQSVAILNFSTVHYFKYILG